MKPIGAQTGGRENGEGRVGGGGQSASQSEIIRWMGSWTDWHSSSESVDGVSQPCDELAARLVVGRVRQTIRRLMLGCWRGEEGRAAEKQSR